MKNLIYLILILCLSVTNIYAQTYGLDERIPNTTFKISFSGDTLAEMELNRVFQNLSFSKLLYLTHAGDGTERIFSVEKDGIIRVFPKDYNVDESAIYLNITSQVNSDPSEAGLLGLAFHPDYITNGKFYVSYNYGNLYSRISEFSVSSNPDSADISSERVIIEIQQPYGNHNGGQISFGPNGYLYIALGDGGSGGDPQGNGQNLQTLLGSILRIDIDHTDEGLQYSIPPDNPFIDNTQGWREEIWAYGLRNPWRFSFDRSEGTLWLADVGQGNWEEVNIIEKGWNYGWKIMEGLHCYSPSSNCDISGLTMPIVEYSHNEGQSITGGYVYRSSNSELSRLSGVYIYGDYVSQRIWGLKYENNTIIENKLIAESPSRIASFGEDEDGEVYVIGYNGRIYIFQEKEGSTSANGVPQTLSESGLYQDIENQVVSPGIIEYSVNSPLWSDGAYKRRYLALSDTSQIIFSESEIWEFPWETILVKEFYFEREKGNPDTREIVETRLLVKHAKEDQWSGFSYIWNDEKTDAYLLTSDTTKTYTISDIQAPGGSYDQDYYYPSREECFRCHTNAAGFVLGLKTSQINKDHIYGDIWDNQLRSYNHIELFNEDIGEDYTNFQTLPDPHDDKYSLESRARSYLDANCASCHLPGGSGRTNLDLRYNTSLEETNLLNIPAELENMGIPDALRINTTSPDSSILFLRMIDTSKFRMPPLASSVVDEEGTNLIRAWIDSLGSPHTLIPAHNQNITKSFRLTSVYPNPFNPSTKIEFAVPEAANLKIRIFNINGQCIKSIDFLAFSPGLHNITWNARNDNGKKVSSGIYFIQVTAEYLHNKTRQDMDSAKLVLLK